MDTNSGVHANTGMTFQKSCTIYLLLERFESIQHRKYFIAMESHDDVVFGFIDEDERLEFIESHQAKKSSSPWTLSKILEIVKKITAASEEILNDPTKKHENFTQDHYFTTNNSIHLTKKIDKTTHSELINETNTIQKFVECNETIKEQITCNSYFPLTEAEKKHLQYLHFRYIDLTRTMKGQYDQLKGMMSSKFTDKISDYDAALKTLFFTLQKIENTFNQKGKAYLTDNSKRIESEQIIAIFDLLTLKKLAFNYWRSKKDEICNSLEITIHDRETFELHYMNSFDKFKDLTEKEHAKVFDFVNRQSTILSKHTTHEGCLNDMFLQFLKSKSTNLSKLQLKAILAAAYVKLYYK